MAADTPVGYYPASGVTGIRLDDRLLFQWKVYSGAGALSYVRLKVATDGPMANLVFDSGWRDADGDLIGDGWAELWPLLMDSEDGLQPATTYHWTVEVENNAAEESAASAALDFTMETAMLTGSDWREAL